MNISHQNLNDEIKKRYWVHGRFWIRRRDWYKYKVRFACLQIEYHFPQGSHWSITFGSGDSNCDLGFTVSIPLLATFYITIKKFFKRPLFTYNFDRGKDRQIGFYFYDKAIWWHIWVGTMASWSRKYPWCRWWRQGSIHFDDVLLGKRKCTTSIVEENIPVTIPMPEGNYRGLAKIEKRVYRRRFWFPATRISTWIDVPKGIPHSGKGENSYDCGDDGIFGCGVEGNNIDKAIGHYVECVLNNRRRYGMPSEGAILKALR